MRVAGVDPDELEDSYPAINIYCRDESPLQESVPELVSPVYVIGVSSVPVLVSIPPVLFVPVFVSPVDDVEPVEALPDSESISPVFVVPVRTHQMLVLPVLYMPVLVPPVFVLIE